MSKGELTRQRILEQTAPLFNQRGFRTAALSEIMEATGLQKGGIYNHFRSKEELALEAFDYAAKAVRGRFSPIGEPANSVEALKSCIVRYREERKHPKIAGGCPLLNSAVESDDAFPALRERVSRLMRSWHVYIQKMVADGRKEGGFRRDVEPAAVATVIITSLQGAVLLGRLQRDEEHMDRVCDHLLSYIDSLRAT